ncbi:MAG: response regulator [bacterium]|nr:response regulator [bacterium]
MKKRRILVIHENGVIRSIIKRTLTAELQDVELYPVSSARAGVKDLEKESYDMVICANEMADLNGAEILKIMRGGEKHKKTGFLLLTSKLDKQNRQSFMESGVTEVLKMPFEAGELTRYVETLSIPRDWRRHRRIEIPDIRMLIQQEKKTIPAQVVNISLGGMLSNLMLKDGVPEFSRYYQLFIQFPENYESVAVMAKGYIVRQAALHWLAPPEPESLQVAWCLEPLSNHDNEIIKEMLDKALVDYS